MGWLADRSLQRSKNLRREHAASRCGYVDNPKTGYPHTHSPYAKPQGSLPEIYKQTQNQSACANGGRERATLPRAKTQRPHVGCADSILQRWSRPARGRQIVRGTAVVYRGRDSSRWHLTGRAETLRRSDFDAKESENLRGGDEPRDTPRRSQSS